MTIADLYRVSAPIPSSITDKTGTGQKPQNSDSVKPGEFGEIFNRELSFSRHAENRIKSREIEWNSDLQNRINQGLNSAQSKGSREALIIADEVAVIVNVKSRTIITAMDKTQMKDRVFTNIDTTVLV